MQNKFKIIVATDYSEASSIAENYAFLLAKSTHSVLRIIHVYDTPLFPTTLNQTEFSKFLEDYKASELKRLQDHSHSLIQTLNLVKDELNLEFVVKEGNVADEILEEVRDWLADFIIAGTHGTTGFREVMFGTHTWGLIKEARVPVLAIPKDVRFKDIKNIVFASEKRDGEIPAINYMVQFVQEIDAQLSILHVATHLLPKEFEMEMFETYVKDLKSKSATENINMKLIFDDSIIEGITKYCLEQNSDWLVVSYKKPSLLEKIVLLNYSNTKQLSFKANVPLFCVPDYYDPQALDI